MRPLTIAAALAALLLASASPSGADLYLTPMGDGSSLVGLSRAGARVRHIGNTAALLEADPDVAFMLEGMGAERIGAALPGERLYVCYPGSGSQSVTEYGRLLWFEPGGAMILAVEPDRLAPLRSSSFHVHELPTDIDTSQWFDDTPPPLVRDREYSRELTVRGLVEDVLASVSTDSLMAHIERLSTYPDESLRTRYTARKECRAEAAFYIMDHLQTYLPVGATVDTQRFWVPEYTCEVEPQETEYSAINVTGTLPGTGRLQGYYILCAHYDATASSSYGQHDLTWWCDSATPGADDNATGVAIMLEAARVLSDYDFPFDVRFVLFSGEELGLYGSAAYADSVSAEGDTIYGVLNVDMVGYKPQAGVPDTCHLVTNRGTRWFADWIIDTVSLYPSHFTDFDMARIDTVLLYSDHANFWYEGYDALVAIEHYAPRDRNPYYHTLEDTLGSIVPSQLSSVGRAVIGSMARLADPDTTFNLAVFPEDLSLSPEDPETGDAVACYVKVHAFGPDELVDMTLTVWDGSPGEGELLTELDVSRVMGGGEVLYHSFPWSPGDDDLGQHEITARIETEDTVELSYADNVAVLDVRVSDDSRLFVMDHYSYPNPAGSAGELAFRYELSREAGGSELTIYDITGQEVGRFQKGASAGDPEPGAGLASGFNTVRWSDLEGSGSGLASGAYIYKLRIYERGGTEPVSEVTGRFAIVR